MSKIIATFGINIFVLIFHIIIFLSVLWVKFGGSEYLAVYSFESVLVFGKLRLRISILIFTQLFHITDVFSLSNLIRSFIHWLSTVSRNIFYSGTLIKIWLSLQKCDVWCFFLKNFWNPFAAHTLRDTDLVEHWIHFHNAVCLFELYFKTQAYQSNP